MPENKVQFGLKSVYYAVLTPAATPGGVPTYSTPVALPGAVTLTLDPVGEVSPFYADNITYYTSVANNGYSGDLEIAMIPDAMLADVWGIEADDAGVIVENSNTQPKSFALLYQIDGDQNNRLYCLYNCSATRPGIGSTTITETKEPQTQSVSITASALADGRVLARTTESTESATVSGWFTSVYTGA